MGLWWYLFAEVFDHFRGFFLFVFHSQPALLLLPLTLRLRAQPTVLLLAACLLVALFKARLSGSSAVQLFPDSNRQPYTCVADLALCLALLPLVLHEVQPPAAAHRWACRAELLSRQQLRSMRVLFIVSAALLLAGLLNPPLWRLWVESFRGNANFVLATTIVQALALTVTISDLAQTALKNH